jgi:hypothetical protein
MGMILIGGGLAAWFWCGQQAERLGRPPADMDPIKAISEYPGARMEVGQWVGAAAAVLGLIVIVMPKGRSF